MIIEYEDQYSEDLKLLLEELQEYIASIDKEHYNIITENSKEQCFLETMKEVEKYKGKILLYKENNNILGTIIGMVNNEEESTSNFKAPKRGRITEFVVTKKVRSKGIGKKLFTEMEEYLKSLGCVDILIGVFRYNDKAIDFYKHNGYHTRMIDMIKKMG